MPSVCSTNPSGVEVNGVQDLGDGQQVEGWYFRAVDPTSGENWVLIVAYWADGESNANGFVELIHWPSGKVYKEFVPDIDLRAIQSGRGELDLWIGGINVTSTSVSGDLLTDTDEWIELNWQIDNCINWGGPSEDGNRSTMGWASNLPVFPIYWHVQHLKSALNGWIYIEDEMRQLNNLVLHQEKNWGRAFPKSWLWLQSNDFRDREDVAFVAAGGPIFNFPLSPHGYMVGLRWKERFFQWRSQDFDHFADAKVEYDPESGMVRWYMVAENLDHRLRIEVEAPREQLIGVDVPTNEGLRQRAFEHLGASMVLSLYERGALGIWRQLDRLESHTAAAEVGGDFAQRVFPGIDL